MIDEAGGNPDFSLAVAKEKEGTRKYRGMYQEGMTHEGRPLAMYAVKEIGG